MGVSNLLVPEVLPVAENNLSHLKNSSVLPISIPAGNYTVQFDVQEEKRMKVKIVILMAVALLMGETAFAQEYDKWEESLDFSYARGNPANVGKPFSLLGGGGALVYNFNGFIGIKLDLQGYGSATRTVNNFVVVNPEGVTTIVNSGAVQSNLFTYMAGPQLRVPAHTFKPFAEFVFGGALTHFHGNLVTATSATNVNSSNNAFAMAVGGGLDIRINKTVSIRPFQMDYLLSRFGNSLIPGGDHNQNNFRYSAGVNLTFGE
jgi:opacity protein-like surface antigen